MASLVVVLGPVVRGGIVCCVFESWKVIRLVRDQERREADELTEGRGRAEVQAKFRTEGA